MTEQATQARKVLVIEDDQEINELLGEYLTLEQIGYTPALTGRAGLEQVEAVHPDAVILDLMLPDIDGYEIARRLTTRRATFDIPVLMLTCMNQDCDRQKGFSAGALYFMNKPFLPDDLLSTLHAAFAWRETLYTRPPEGEVLVSTSTQFDTIRQLNNMVADLFAHTNLSDAAVAQIREAFESLATWALEWGANNKQDPRLRIGYRILSGNLLSSDRSATAVEWTLAEESPALLAAAFFPAPPEEPAAPAPRFSIAGFSFGTKASPAPATLSSPAAAGTMANWFQFLGKTGAAQFDRDSATQRVRVVRSLTGEPGVPVLNTDGNRTFPHRVREEAMAARKKG